MRLYSGLTSLLYADYREASISVSSDSSDDSGPDMGASNDPAVTDDEDTETDTDNPLDVTQPPTKRRRGKSFWPYIVHALILPCRH